jgi:hypothetical protein
MLITVAGDCRPPLLVFHNCKPTGSKPVGLRMNLYLIEKSRFVYLKSYSLVSFSGGGGGTRMAVDCGCLFSVNTWSELYTP